MPRLPHAREGLTLKISKIRSGRVKFYLGPPFHIFPDGIFEGLQPPPNTPSSPLGILCYNYGQNFSAFLTGDDFYATFFNKKYSNKDNSIN